MNKAPVQIVCTTCPPDRAQALAEALVTEELAGCVQIVGPIRSVYRWQGALTQTEESLLLIKGPAHHYAALQQRLVALHPYELPEIIAVPVVDGLPAYLAWLFT